MKQKIMRKYFLLIGLIFIFAFALLGQENLIKLKVATEQANIRLKPDIGSIIIHQAPQGTILDSTGKENEWYRITIRTKEGDQVTGYVHESLVIEIRTPGQEKETIETLREKPEIKTPPKIQVETPELISEPAPPPEARVNLSLSGGGLYFPGGDLNKGAEGLVDFYSDDLEVQEVGEIKPLHLSYVFGGELNLPFSSKFSLGLGIDYLSGKQESTVEFPTETSFDTFTSRSKVEVYPIRFCLSFYPAPYFYMKSGVEILIAKTTYFYHFELEDFYQEWNGEADAQGIGYLGSLGLVIAPKSRVNFFMEVTGRYAKISGFKGKNIFTDSTEYQDTEEGKLYFYKITSDGISYPRLFIWEREPSEAGVTDVKEAVIDLSGISLRAGFRIRF